MTTIPLWLNDDRVEPRTILVGADATLVGEISGVSGDVMTVTRAPLPSILLPVHMIAHAQDGVAILDVPGAEADLLGERMVRNDRARTALV